jgi:hypothetical protein
MSIAAQPAVKMPYLLAVFRLPKLISNSFCSIFLVKTMSIFPANHMPSIYNRKKSSIHACAKQISFSPKSLNCFFGAQGFLLLAYYVFLLPASAQIVTTQTGIDVNAAIQATAGSPGAIAIGSAASSSGLNAISIGIDAAASGDRSVAIGPQFGGNNTKAIGDRSVALGSGAQTGNDFATALGANANAGGNRAVAIGINSEASAESALAIGQNSKALGLRATALGAAAEATAIRSTAIGNNALATVENASAFGFAAISSAFNSTAIGANSVASGEFSTSLGAQSQAIAPFSTAIGLNAIATKPNQIVIGTNISNLTIPSLGQGGSFLGTANQNGSTRLLSTDGEGNLGTTNISSSQVERIPAIESAMSKIGTAMNAGTSIALALSAVPTASEDPREPIRCGVGTGGYGGTYAFGLGCAAKIFNRVQINGGLSFAPSVDYGYGTTPRVGGRIGFSFPLGVYSQSSRSSAPVSASTLSGISDGNTRAIIEQLRNDLDQQKQITVKLQQQLQALT